jgi:hypothetical protein
MVPVTRYERHVIEEEIPYTVCRKVKVQECRQVPVKLARIVHEVCTKQVPVTVRRMVPETVTRQVVVNKTRQVRGAYVDKKGVGHANPWLGRRFVEGACWEKTLTCVKRRTVCEETVRQVPCVNYKMVMEKRVKQVPYTVCRMEQRSTTRMVNCKVTDMVEETKTRKIPYTVCTIVLPHPGGEGKGVRNGALHREGSGAGHLHGADRVPGEKARAHLRGKRCLCEAAPTGPGLPGSLPAGADAACATGGPGATAGPAGSPGAVCPIPQKPVAFHPGADHQTVLHPKPIGLAAPLCDPPFPKNGTGDRFWQPLNPLTSLQIFGKMCYQRINHRVFG